MFSPEIPTLSRLPEHRQATVARFVCRFSLDGSPCCVHLHTNNISHIDHYCCMTHPYSSTGQRCLPALYVSSLRYTCVPFFLYIVPLVRSFLTEQLPTTTPKSLFLFTLLRSLVSSVAMSLSGCRDYILRHVSSGNYRVGSQILRGVRRGNEVVNAAQAYLRAHRISRANWSTSDLANAVCNDLRRAGVIVLQSRGPYQTVRPRSDCFLYVRSGYPTQLRNLQSGLPWSRRWLVIGGNTIHCCVLKLRNIHVHTASLPFPPQTRRLMRVCKWHHPHKQGLRFRTTFSAKLITPDADFFIALDRI